VVGAAAYSAGVGFDVAAFVAVGAGADFVPERGTDGGCAVGLLRIPAFAVAAVAGARAAWWRVGIVDVLRTAIGRGLVSARTESGLAGFGVSLVDLPNVTTYGR
jgi:hypothetical protein